MPTAAHRRHLLRAQSRLAALVADVARDLAAELPRRPVPDLALRRLRAEVAEALMRFHPAYAGGFAAALDRSVRESLPGNRPQSLDLDALEIMDDQRVQEEVEVVQAGQILSDECARAVHQLQRLESVLRAEPSRKVVPSPIGPNAIGRALWRATERLPLGLAGRSETVRATVRLMAPKLGPLYDVLVAEAEADEGVSAQTGGVRAPVASDDPEHARAVAMRAVAAGLAPPLKAVPEASSPGARRARDDEPVGFDVTRPGALFALLESGAARRGGPPSPPTHVPTQPMPPEGDDPRVPGLIHKHREALAAIGTGAPSEAQALITRIFDEIVADPTLPPDASGWLGRLEPAVVLLAGRDPELLQTHRHPAWTFVNRLAMLLCEDPAARPPDLSKWLHAVTTAILSDPTPARFDAACRKIAQWRREQARRRLTAVESALDLLRRHAALEPQVAAARPRLTRRLDAAGADALVRRFVLSIWALACAQQDAGAQAVPPGGADAWDTALDLIWSTAPARSRADAPALVPMIPTLVERLRSGMAALGLAADARDAWLDRLAPLHVKALQRPAEEAATDAPITMDLTLEDMLPMEGAVAGGATEEEAAAAAADTEADSVPFELGDRLAMQVDGEWEELQLVWISDNGHFLLLAGAEGRSRSLTRRSMVRLLREGLARTSDTATVLARATRRLSRG